MLPACSATKWLERHLYTACGGEYASAYHNASAFNGVARLQRLNLSEDPAARVLTQSRVCKGPRSTERMSWSTCRLEKGQTWPIPVGLED